MNAVFSLIKEENPNTSVMFFRLCNNVDMFSSTAERYGLLPFVDQEAMRNTYDRKKYAVVHDVFPYDGFFGVDTSVLDARKGRSDASMLDRKDLSGSLGSYLDNRMNHRLLMTEIAKKIA